MHFAEIHASFADTQGSLADACRELHAPRSCAMNKSLFKRKYRALLRRYRALLRIYRALLRIYRALLRIYRPLLRIHGALLHLYRPLLRMYRALLRIYRALLRIYRALLRIYRALLANVQGSFVNIQSSFADTYRELHAPRSRAHLLHHRLALENKKIWTVSWNSCFTAVAYVCIRKRALHVRKRALYICKRALHIRKRAIRISRVLKVSIMAIAYSQLSSSQTSQNFYSYKADGQKSKFPRSFL